MLRFQGPKTLAAWLRSSLGYEIRTNLVAEEAWAHPRVLILTEGNCVSVYVDGVVAVKHVDRPVCQTPAGNDLADELLTARVGPMWEGLRYRMSFWADTRSVRERAIAEVWG